MSQSRPEPSEIAGRYHIIQKLGAGAFGTVYKARDTTLGRELAIKTIRLEGLAAASTDLDELLKRFKQEATAGAALKHPNIVTVYDFGQSEGMTYLAMEYVEGVGLERIIKEVGKLPIDRAAGIAAQVADALGYAHEKKVIHRDIKPANIMVEAGERVKVTDFGIARVTDSAEQLTATGGILGTPSYMSPEQARGRTVDGRSDLFSVGCVLYELLAGRKAFTGDNISAIIFKIIAEEPQSIQELDPLLPDEMVQVVKKALAKEPDARYQTGQELAADLLALTQPGHVPTVRQADTPTARAAASGNAPTIASAPTASGSISATPTAARPLVAGGATAPEAPGTAPVAATQLLEGAGTQPPPPLPGAETPRRPTPAPPRRSARPAKKSGVGRVVAIAAAAVVLLAIGGLGAWMVLGRGGSQAPREAGQVGVGIPPEDVAASPTAAVPTPGVPTPGGVGAVSGPAAEVARATPAPRAGAVPGQAAPGGARGAGTAGVPAESGGVVSGGATAGGAVSERAGGAALGGGETAAAPATSTAALAPPLEDNFLDELPEAQVDSRAAARGLSDAYGSGGNRPKFGATASFGKRPRIPRDTRPPEVPAVRTLAWILSAQNAHLRRTGRYGGLDELVSSGDFPYPGERTSDGFDRRQYRFTITAAGEEFRADARPLSPRGRAFYVDDNGFVLVADE